MPAMAPSTAYGSPSWPRAISMTKPAITATTSTMPANIDASLSMPRIRSS